MSIHAPHSRAASTHQIDSGEQGRFGDDETMDTLRPEQAAVLEKAGEWESSEGMPPFGHFSTRADGKKRLYETTRYAPNNNDKRQIILTAEENGTLTVTEYWRLGERVYQRQVYQGSGLRAANTAADAVYASFTASGHQDKDLGACLRKQGLLSITIGPRSRTSGLT